MVLDINERGSKTLKTPSSQRRIPVHQDVIDLRFKEYCDGLRAKGETELFPFLKDGAHGRGRNITDNFSRYLKRLGVKTPKKTFHSMRHTMIEALRNASVSRSDIQAIVGHKDNSITFDTYTQGVSPGVLYESISKIDFRPFIADLIETDNKHR